MFPSFDADPRVREDEILRAIEFCARNFFAAMEKYTRESYPDNLSWMLPRLQEWVDLVANIRTRKQLLLYPYDGLEVSDVGLKEAINRDVRELKNYVFNEEFDKRKFLVTFAELVHHRLAHGVNFRDFSFSESIEDAVLVR